MRRAGREHGAGEQARALGAVGDRPPPRSIASGGVLRTVTLSRPGSSAGGLTRARDDSDAAIRLATVEASTVWLVTSLVCQTWD